VKRGTKTAEVSNLPAEQSTGAERQRGEFIDETPVVCELIPERESRDPQVGVVVHLVGEVTGIPGDLPAIE